MISLVRSLVPEDFRQAVTPPLRRFYVCTTVMCFGFGLALSMFVVYLHNVRGFSITFATMALLVAATVALLVAPLLGTLTDRFGPVAVMVASCVLFGVAEAIWAFATVAWIVVVTAVVMSSLGGSLFGSGSVLMARLVDEEHHQRAFGVQFMLVNLGVGLGGLVSAVVVNLSHPVTFTALYLGGAVFSFVAAALLLTLWRFGHAEPHHDPETPPTSGGWGEVARDRRLRAYVLASLVIGIAGYGSIDAGFSLYVVNNLHLSVHVVGLTFFFNTATIVVAQLVVLNRIEGKSRTRVMAIAGMLWGFFWMVLALCHLFPAWVAVMAMCVAMAVFALGETMMTPVGPAIVNQLAAEHLRGRYNSASQLVWNLGFTIAPAITALAFGLGIGEYWPVLIAVSALVGSAMLLNLRRHLSEGEDGTEPAIAS